MSRAIDVHVHLAALPDGENGCHISPRMMRSPLFRFMALRHGLDLRNPAAGNATYLDRLLKGLGRSEKVGQAVLLAMDGVYDAKGHLDLARTHFLIANGYVLQVSKRQPGYFLPGVSINPQRRDAVEELERCAEAGAVLVKVLPNAQCFDPAEERYIPFYRALVKHRMPLLSHMGNEFSLIGKDQSAGDPGRLALALEEGVCVIAAHSCSYGLIFFEPYFKVMQEFLRRYPNLYADTSGLTLPNRVKTLFLLRRHPEIYDRLIFGTDYPLPVFSYPALGRSYTKAVGASTPFDRQALVLEGLRIQYKDFSFLRTNLRG